MNSQKIKSIILLLVSIISLNSCAGIFRNKDDNENAFMGLGFGAQNKKFDLPVGATVQKDLAYGVEREQTLDIYLPKKELIKINSPIIIMVHGGAWMFGDKANHPVVANKINRWLKKGVVFVSINYRMSRSPNPLDQVDDVEAAVAFIIANASKYGADPKKIILMGHSAGAHLISLMNSHSKFSKNYPNNHWLGIISLDSAAFDLVEIMEQKHYRFYDRVFGNDKNFWDSTSPLHQLKEKISPTLLVCSTKRSDSCPQAEAFAKKANLTGSLSQVLKVPLSHGEVNLNLGLEENYTQEVEKFMKGLGVNID